MKTYQALLNPLYTRGLALGGGSTLGAAHIGVLRAIEEKAITIDCIAGTSIGSLIATLYAFGKSIDEIEQIALHMDFQGIGSLHLSKLSLFSNKKLGTLVKKVIGDVNIEDAAIPLAIVATNIATGRQVVFKSGPAAEAIMASTCLPGVFEPVEINGQLLVDGGLVENVPVSAIASMGANSLIAVDLNEKAKYNEPNDIFDVISNSISIAIDNNTLSRTRIADLRIAPDLTAHSRTDTNPESIQKMIAIGYRETLSRLDETLGFKQWLIAISKQILRALYSPIYLSSH